MEVSPTPPVLDIPVPWKLKPLILLAQKVVRWESIRKKKVKRLSRPPRQKRSYWAKFSWGKLAQGRCCNGISCTPSVMWHDYMYSEHGIILVLASGISSMPHNSLSAVLCFSCNKTLPFIQWMCWLFLFTQVPPCLIVSLLRTQQKVIGKGYDFGFCLGNSPFKYLFYKIRQKCKSFWFC